MLAVPRVGRRCGAPLLQLQDLSGFQGMVVSTNVGKVEGKVVPTALGKAKGKIVSTSLGFQGKVVPTALSKVQGTVVPTTPGQVQGKVVPTSLGKAAAEAGASEDWAQRGAEAARGLFSKVKSQGKAGVLSLVAETVVFWIAILIPASLFLYHQQTGLWAPDSGDPESWAAFTTILGSCYVFCKIPPIEAARWAWVLAWTPWMAENLLGESPGSDQVDVSAQAGGLIADE